MIRPEQSSNNLPEQFFDIKIIVRKLPDPLVNAPPFNDRAVVASSRKATEAFVLRTTLGENGSSFLERRSNKPFANPTILPSLFSVSSDTESRTDSTTALRSLDEIV